METPQSGVSPHTTTKWRRQNSHLHQATANDENIDPSPSNSSQKRPKTSSTFTPHSHSGSQRQSVRTEAKKMKNSQEKIACLSRSRRSDGYEVNLVQNFAYTIQLVTVRLECGEGCEKDLSDQSKAFWE
ncbi:hypothetical protein B0H17DRAFT_1150040 [Mycena rosella]|uniref:Uncharacterized protein n=1 Tax=Mycena rosella TaxID=1033263 RepID=A0AAD7BWQ1_MYCRO|nr:hypothetical protein B0H17DRAFT_1150040 [Mycena rosella]